MDKYALRFGVLPFLLLGAGLLLIGLLAINHIVDTFWAIDVSRIDLVRDVALDRADPALLLQAANIESIMAFLAGVLVAVTGLALPLAYYLNKRFGDTTAPYFMVVLRQAMLVGVWVAFCTWLQMNRTLGWGVALLVAAVLVILEILLQVRLRTFQAGGETE